MVSFNRFLLLAPALVMAGILFAATNTTTQHTLNKCLRPIPDDPTVNIDHDFYLTPVTYKLEKKGFPFTFYHQEPERCGSEMIIKESSLPLFVANMALWLGAGALIGSLAIRKKNKKIKKR